MIKIGVIGYGYWGPNIVRNFSNFEYAQVTAVCDKRVDALKSVHRISGGIKTCTDCNEILDSNEIDVVAIVTPVATHYELVKKALLKGKHVFVEKPFTDSSAHAQELIELSEKVQRTIMVDHTFLFTGAVNSIKDIINKNILGKIYYYDSTRVNLGLFQHDVNVIWDLAPHDFSVMLHLLDERPTAIVATGKSHVNGMEDVAYVTAYFDSNIIAHFNVNWLSPVKVRNTLIGGEQKMLVWNDVNTDEKIKIYDKGIEVHNRESIYDLLVSYRSGDMYSPKVDQTEALRLECQHFLTCLINNKKPINDGIAGLEVVKLLEACNESLKNEGKMVHIKNEKKEVLLKKTLEK